MSRIIRTTLHCLFLALACAASAHAAPQGSSRAKLDFGSCAKPQYPAADVQARSRSAFSSTRTAR